MPVYCLHCRASFPTYVAHALAHPNTLHELRVEAVHVLRGEEPRPHETETWPPTWPGGEAA